ncbi:glycosyltransferase family 61 protein [uncultured Sulfitobacter sp.]|uniref:glycosyltransferase family 61 protein n=1 Tax=uncultured Sulfitobacter sp. TaxID=191468 RepID=UPI0026381267|nr:glycosyltransferase family 61 protein [uncultured Sulfitobacter sp.]
MRNKVDMSLPIDELFLDPWQDGGFALLSAPQFYWRTKDGGVIEGFSVSAYPEIEAKTTAVVDAIQRHRNLSTTIEYESVPVLIQPASFRKSMVMVNRRLFLSGAAGTRAINTWRRANEDAGNDIETELAAYFERCQQENAKTELPVVDRMPDPETPFVIECRNTFNYFHFVTESLCQLALLERTNLTGEIFFHFPNREDKTRPFVEDFVKELFPEIFSRVRFERVPKEYDQAVTAYDLLSLYPFASETLYADLRQQVKPGILDKGVNSDIANWRIVSGNGYSTVLSALRDRALRLVEGRDFGPLPKRFFVGRDDRHSRARPMAGQDRLFEHLALFGFEHVVFENLSPLEQIALMAQAEIVVMPHGAGLTNMMFAPPSACVIELGTLQTAQHRWDDFWPLAHLARCRFVSFFADFNTDTPLQEPDFQTDGIVPVALSDSAVAQIMAFVVSIMGHIPEISAPDILLRLVERIAAVESPDAALALLDAHDALVVADADLSLLRADCHKALDQPKSELVALDQSFKADRSRWQTLIRIIWCANRCDRPQVIRWARSQLEREFPDRYAAFVGNHDWVRYVV